MTDIWYLTFYSGFTHEQIIVKLRAIVIEWSYCNCKFEEILSNTNSADSEIAENRRRYTKSPFGFWPYNYNYKLASNKFPLTVISSYCGKIEMTGRRTGFCKLVTGKVRKFPGNTKPARFFNKKLHCGVDEDDVIVMSSHDPAKDKDYETPSLSGDPKIPASILIMGDITTSIRACNDMCPTFLPVNHDYPMQEPVARHSHCLSQESSVFDLWPSQESAGHDCCVPDRPVSVQRITAESVDNNAEINTNAKNSATEVSTNATNLVVTHQHVMARGIVKHYIFITIGALGKILAALLTCLAQVFSTAFDMEQVAVKIEQGQLERANRLLRTRLHTKDADLPEPQMPGPSPKCQCCRTSLCLNIINQQWNTDTTTGRPSTSDKHVHFKDDANIQTIQYIIGWPEEYQETRKPYWELFSVDRMHFKQRIAGVEKVLSKCLVVGPPSKFKESVSLHAQACKSSQG